MNKFYWHIGTSLKSQLAAARPTLVTMGSASDVLELLRSYWAVLLGNTLEWYEFAVYGCLDAEVH